MYLDRLSSASSFPPFWRNPAFSCSAEILALGFSTLKKLQINENKCMEIEIKF